MKTLSNLGLVAALLVMTVLASYGQSQTEKEITQMIRDGNAYANANLTTQDNYSKHGALEFWSSGGLLQEITSAGRSTDFDAINIEAKHIRVVTLVEGQAAVAHYYSEGSMTPKGSPPVHNYLTRVSQVFVKEDGKWKIRSSHWSPITGGGGTSQTALEK